MQFYRFVFVHDVDGVWIPQPARLPVAARHQEATRQKLVKNSGTSKTVEVIDIVKDDSHLYGARESHCRSVTAKRASASKPLLNCAATSE